MKNLKIFTLLFFVMLVPITIITGCGQNKLDLNGLEFGVKYYYSNSEVKQENINNNKIEYYVFNADGTGSYRFYINSSSSDNYTATFKYTQIDESSIVINYTDKDCIYDNGSAPSGGKIYSTLLGISKDVLMQVNSLGYSFYYNQNYLQKNNYIN